MRMRKRAHCQKTTPSPRCSLRNWDVSERVLLNVFDINPHITTRRLIRNNFPDLLNKRGLLNAAPNLIPKPPLAIVLQIDPQAIRWRWLPFLQVLFQKTCNIWFLFYFFVTKNWVICNCRSSQHWINVCFLLKNEF